MSTRATYTFESSTLPTLHYYIHHDGYPSGAAYYFWNMLKEGQKCEIASRYLDFENQGSRDLALTFARANRMAGLISHPNVYGDIEYRYTINVETNYLTVWSRDFYDNTWKVFYSGPWISFVNLNHDLIEDWSPVISNPNQPTEFLTEDYLEKLIRLEKEKLKDFREKSPQVSFLERNVERFEQLMNSYIKEANKLHVY